MNARTLRGKVAVVGIGETTYYKHGQSPDAEFKLALQAKAGTEGKLFGSVGTSDIAEALTRGGIAIERAEVRLPGGPIRLLGEHHVKLHLHTDVEIDLPVVITAED